MKKRLNVQHYDGVISIQGNHQEAVLYLNKQPIQYTWYAEVGSTWRFHIAKNLPKNSIRENAENQELVRNGIKTINDFYAIVNYYQQFLERGEYEFGYYCLHTHHDWIDIPKGDQFNHFDYYGGCPDLCPTQNNIDQSMVDFYVEEIKKGQKPVIILLHNEESYITFILDGHHKFLAYRKLNSKPVAVIITRIGESPLNEKQALELAQRMNCTDERFLKSIRDEKNDTYFEMRMNLDKTYEEIN